MCIAVTIHLRYFFESNPESNGCSSPSDPGYEQMEWLRIQLQFIRQRGMKAILIGHVPPARTESRANWEESCWQRYTLWLRQYRDVVVGSLYGHMNIDHFMLQDSKDVDIIGLQNKALREKSRRTIMDRHCLVQNAADYLIELRESWSKLPNPPKGPSKKNSKEDEKQRQKKYLRKIGGEWAERYMIAHVSPSVIPNYFPSLRVIEYNTTGLEDVNLDSRHGSNIQAVQDETMNEDALGTWGCDTMSLLDETAKLSLGKWSNKKKKMSKKPHFIIPDPPSKSAPPGPAYSPQTFTWLGYAQYYANLTYLNNEPTNRKVTQGSEQRSSKQDSKDFEEKPFGDSLQQQHTEQRPRKFNYEVEYNTFDDEIYKLRDMTVRSYLQLARRIGKYKPKGEDKLDSFTKVDDNDEDPVDAGGGDEAISPDNRESQGNSAVITRKKHKKHKGHRRHKKHRGTNNKVWFTFLKRAFVGAKDDQDIHDEYGIPIAAHPRKPVEVPEGDNEL